MADVLWNVPFKKFLQFDGHFAKPLATHFVIPCYHFPTVPLFDIGFYPIGYSLVFTARGHELLKGVRSANTPDPYSTGTSLCRTPLLGLRVLRAT